MKIETRITCPFCGQQRFEEMEEAVANDPAVLKERAIQSCTCERATVHRGMQRTEHAISSLLGEGAKERGYDYELHEDTVAAITDICRNMLMSNYDKVQLEEPNGDLIKLITDGNAVKVTRISKRQITM